MELMELERRIEVQEDFTKAMSIPRYRPPTRPNVYTPRAKMPGKVIWIMKDGKEVSTK